MTETESPGNLGHRYHIIADGRVIHGEPTWERARRVAVWASSDRTYDVIEIFHSMARKGHPELWRIVGSEPEIVRRKGQQ